MAIAPDLFKSGMRRLAAGVSIITTLGPDGPRGMTATAICSVSADPPTLLCCVNRAASPHDAIGASGVLAVNLLAGSDRALARSFSMGEDAAARFAQGSWTRLATGAPILATALASFDCRVVNRVECSTHSVFIAEVVDARSGAGHLPLLYFGGGYGDFVATETQASERAGMQPRE